MPVPAGAQRRCTMVVEDVLVTDAPLAGAPWIRTVEVVGLDTVARLCGFRHQVLAQVDPVYNIYSRSFAAHPEVLHAVWCRDVELVPHPAWKICAEEHFFIDEIGMSEKSRIAGMECWPEFGGRYHLRFDAPVLRAPRTGRPYFLLGGDPNHYHWLVNFVPRLMVLDQLEQLGLVKGGVHIVVPDLMSDNALRLIRELGMGHHTITRLHSRAVWRFDELITPSFFQHSDLTPNGFAWYKRRLTVQPSRKPWRRLVISRADASGGHPRRRVLNEQAMVDALVPLGFTPVNLSRLTMAEQMQLFHETEMVIGPHGAGFANMVFAQAGARAIVLENSWNHSFMADMVTVAGGTARVLVCEDVIDEALEATHLVDGQVHPEMRRNRDMHVDVQQLLGLVQEMLP
jgi:hypothetical protein